MVSVQVEGTACVKESPEAGMTEGQNFERRTLY